MSDMKAVRLHAYGGTDVLVYEDAPRPMPGEGQVLIRVQAAAVNRADPVIRSGVLKDFLKLTFPVILGSDFAGLIEEVGAGVTDFKPGDKVYAYHRAGGSNAEFAVLPVEEVAFAPKSIDVIHAAAVPTSAVIAWQALVAQANLMEGQSILIHGAAGGVGHVASQLAKWKGAKVIGTAGNNFEFLKNLDLDQAINYQTTTFEDEVSDLDVVLDIIGGEIYERSAKVLKPGGVLVSTKKPLEGGPSEQVEANYDVRQELIYGRPPIRETLTQIAELIDAGHIKVHVTDVLPLAEAAKGHEMIATGHRAGKIVLQIAQ